MSAETTTVITRPQVFPQCANCEFAQRAAQGGQSRFPLAEVLTLECKLLGGGGTRLVAPGRRVDFLSRIITVTPKVISPGMESEYQEGRIPTCPHDIEDSAQEYPHHPYLKTVTTDIFGRTVRE